MAIVTLNTEQTRYASDVIVENRDFTSFLDQNRGTRVLFPVVSPKGSSYPTLVSADEVISRYGDVAPDNMLFSLLTAMSTGSHYVLRVTPENVRFAAAIIGIFQNGGGAPYLDMAALKPATNPNVAPIYSNGGLPLKTDRYVVADALEDGGATFFRSTTAEAASVASSLVEARYMIWADGPGVDGDNVTTKIVSDNVKQLGPIVTAVKRPGGNLQEGTYAYHRVAVTAKGERAESISVVTSVTISPADVAAGNRSIQLTWAADDPSARGILVYRVFTPTTGTNLTNSGRVAELRNGVTGYTDDTFRVLEAVESVISARTSYDDEFLLEVYYKGALVQTIPFALSSIDRPDSPPPLDKAIANNPGYLRCKSLIDKDYIQGTTSGTSPVVFTTPLTTLAGGFNGTGTPTVQDLARALEPFLNRDRYRITNIVDLGWADPAATVEFAKIDAAQRSNSLHSVPLNRESAQASAAYAASLQGVNRRQSLYTGWLERRDQKTGITRKASPAAYACQALLLSDAVRNPGFSFAGLQRGLIDATVPRDPDFLVYAPDERDLMAKARVNYFRRRPVGIALWEDFTLQEQLSAASYVHVSRIWDVLQNTIADYLEFYLKEPNDSYLIAEIRAGSGNYLKSLKDDRAIRDFTIIMEDGTAGNSPDTVNQGGRNIDIYIEPMVAVRRFLLRTSLVNNVASFADLVQI